MTYSEQFLQPINSPITPSGAMVDQPQPITVANSGMAKTGITTAQTGLVNAETGLQNQSVKAQQAKLVGDQRAASELSLQEFAQRAGVDPSRVVSNPNGVGFIVGPESKAGDLSAINAKVDAVLAEPGIDPKTGEPYGQTTKVIAGTTSTNSLQTLSDQLTEQWNKTQQELADIANGTHPLTAGEQAQLDDIQRTADILKGKQEIYNINYTGGITNIGISRGLSRYAPELAQGAIFQSISDGKTKIDEIQSEATQAINSLRQAFIDSDYERIRDSWTRYQTYMKDREDTLTKIQDTATKELQRQQDLDKQARTDQYNQITKPIQDIAKEAAKNFATPDVIAAINKAKTVEEAISAAGSSLTTATGTLGEYLQYKRDAVAAGQTPTDYQAYKIAEETRIAKAKQSNAYSSAYSSAAGRLAAEAKAAGLNAPMVDTIVTDPVSKSILAQTGLSIPAFSFLTKGTQALTRMTAAQRLQYMNEAEKWANTKGIDISTFQSQYSALNKTVEANVLRNNQAAVAEAESDATLQNVKTAAEEANLGDLSKYNVAKVWAGKQLNKSDAITFLFHLEQLRREFAMYNAAIEGQIDANGNIRQINDADMNRADKVIQDGFAAGSIEGFEQALTRSREKMKVVLDQSISAQNQQVWKLFGVGENYQNTGESLIKQGENDIQSIADFGSKSPENQKRIDDLSKIAPDATPSEIKKQLGI